MDGEKVAITGMGKKYGGSHTQEDRDTKGTKEKKIKDEHMKETIPH
jgi:hypothetical protein